MGIGIPLRRQERRTISGAVFEGKGILW